ncbi:MAG: flagellar basal body rod protein FlgB [Salinisphaeraceae bacterium]|jgi:flagellar basal-body rod protein FlgB|nr:flagellar basal body rod protein FlgB [Salinisphaeraceae bacterium]
MSQLNDPIFGVHAQALTVNRQRLETLSANIANADTPGFKAQDVDFRRVLDSYAPNDVQMQATSAGHIGGNASAGGLPDSALFERESLQPSADGNTVDVDREQAAFADAALRYRASLSFADGRLRSLLTAITGGR